MTVHYLALDDYLAIAGEVTGQQDETLINAAKTDLADSALHAPAASFAGEEFYPDFVDKAAVRERGRSNDHRSWLYQVLGSGLAAGNQSLQEPVRTTLSPMGSITWDRDLAEVYDKVYSTKADPSVLNPMVELLTELAGGGPALELAIGTGRVALPLSGRLRVEGIELSPHMVERLRAKPGAEAVPVTVGDMTSTRLGRTFKLVYLVANSIMNVTTQDEQLAVFFNAAAHLDVGGCFVLEVMVPQIRRVPSSELARVFTLDPDHIGVETFDDPVGQVAWSHHWMEVDGRLVRHSAPYRYVWPSELDLMGKIADFRLQDRWADWTRQEFSSDSHNQIAVYEKLD